MITSLTLKNWRTHADTTLEFGKGTNVIIGVMGSGKSSIVNAISYSLFGTFPALKGKQVALKEIIMNKPNQMNTAETAIEFTQNENKYRVERIIKMDGTNEGKLLENGKFIAGPKQKDVNEKIEMLLGMDYELFSRAVYAEQNELDFFLKLSPGDRKKKFDELLQLEKYESARKNSIALQNELVKESKTHEKMLEQQKELLKGHEEEKIITSIEHATIELEQLENQTTKVKTELIELETQYKLISEKEKKQKELLEVILKLKTRIESLQEDIKKADGISITTVINSLSEVKNSLNIIKTEQGILEQKQKIIDTEIKKIREEGKVLEYRAKKSEEEMKHITTLKGTCPTCKQLLDEKHKSELIEKEHKLLQETLLEKKKLEETAQTLLVQFQEIEKEVNQKKKTSEEFTKKVYLLESDERRAKEVQEKQKLLTQFVEELPLKEKQLTEIGFDSKLLETSREKYYNKRSEGEILLTKTKAKLELKKSYEVTLAKLEGIKKTILQSEKEIITYSEASKKMGIFANCLMATQGELRNAMLETINRAMTNIWETIYPYRDFTDARLAITEDGYDLQVLTRSNGWVRVEGILSGGERSAAALCIRMSFALVLTKNLSMLILDEPTHNLDSTAVSKLSAMLREEMPKLVEQIFVITHDKELEAAASSNLYSLTRDKDSDEATKVEIMPIM